MTLCQYLSQAMSNDNGKTIINDSLTDLSREPPAYKADVLSAFQSVMWNGKEEKLHNVTYTGIPLTDFQDANGIHFKVQASSVGEWNWFREDKDSRVANSLLLFRKKYYLGMEMSGYACSTEPVLNRLNQNLCNCSAA
jgi:hypothetical protein